MSDEWVMVPRDLLQRVDAALQRHLDRHAPMRIPVDQTDSDLVQSDVQALIAAPAAPQQAEPVAWMAFGGSIVHVVTRNAMDPIEAERFDVPLYLHPPAAEVQRLRDALRWAIREVERNTCTHEETHRVGAIWTICDSCNRKWADDIGGFKPYTDPPELIEARRALEGGE